MTSSNSKSHTYEAISADTCTSVESSTGVRLVVLAAVLALAGCASNGNNSAPTIDQTGYVNPPVSLIKTDSRVTIDGVGSVIVGRRYIAASGRVCRHLNALDGKRLPHRYCQLKSGKWYATRSIAASEPYQAPANIVKVSSTTKASTSKQVSAAKPIETLNDVTVPVALNPGESLWSFSSRVTGDPLNWRKIAADNSIADAKSVSPGQVLLVSRSLAKEAL